MPDYRNPFIVGRPVPPERFIGREKEAKAILHRLAGPAPDNTAVSGEALIGKTSLLHYIASPEIAQKWGLSPEKSMFIFVDSQTIVPFSPVEFWRYVLRSLAAREVHDPGYIAGLLEGDDIGSFELGEFFDRIARDGKLIVLLLDEFEHIVERVNPDDPQFLKLLRALINRPAYGLALVLASRKPLTELCQNMRFVGSPFMTSFISLSLGPFSPEEADTLIDIYTQGTEVTFSDRDREFAYEISRGHPYWLQKTCFKLLQRHKEKVRMSDEQPSPLGNSDYGEITEEIAEETKEPDERLLSGEQPSPPDDSDYEVIAAEAENARHISLGGLWDRLSRYPIAWFAIGVIIVVIITVLFFDPLCCVLEFRLTEATVALITLLAVGVASITFSLAPPQTDKVLKGLYGGVAVTFIIVVIVMQFSPPPSREDCFPARVLTPTAAPVPTYTMTPTSTETLTNTP